MNTLKLSQATIPTNTQNVITSRAKARKVQKAFNKRGLKASGSDLKRVNGWGVDVAPIKKKVRVFRVVGGLIQGGK